MRGDQLPVLLERVQQVEQRHRPLDDVDDVGASDVEQRRVLHVLEHSLSDRKERNQLLGLTSGAGAIFGKVGLGDRVRHRLLKDFQSRLERPKTGLRLDGPELHEPKLT